MPLFIIFVVLLLPCCVFSCYKCISGLVLGAKAQQSLPEKSDGDGEEDAADGEAEAQAQEQEKGTSPLKEVSATKEKEAEFDKNKMAKDTDKEHTVKSSGRRKRKVRVPVKPPRSEEE